MRPCASPVGAAPRPPSQLSPRMLTLNLENVDSPEAWDCPLVLTSPRSLAACRLLDVKPVELLPSDIIELAETTGTSDLAKLADLRDRLEHRRLTKLEHCRAIRWYLISQNAIDEHDLVASHKYQNEFGDLSKEDSPSQDDHILETPSRCSVSFQRQTALSRKERLDSENRAVAQQRKNSSRESSARPPSRSSSRRPPTRSSDVQPVVVDCFGRTNFSQNCVEIEATVPRRSQPRRQMRSGKRCETPISDKMTSSSDGDSPQIAEYPSRPMRSVASQRRAQNCKKNPSETLIEIGPKTDINNAVRTVRNFEMDRRVNRPQSANISDLGRTATPHGAHGAHGANGHRRKPCKLPRRRARSLSASRRLANTPTPTVAPPPPLSAFGGDVSEPVFRERSTRCLQQQIRIKSPQYFSCRNKIAALGTQWRRTAEAVGLSEEDQKILRLLEKKALEKRASEMTAEAARILWEREEEQRTKRQEWEKERRKLEVAERRKEDKAETKRRLAYLEKNFNRAQRRLTDTLRRRDDEAQQRLVKIAQQKDAMRAEKKAADLARQASVEKRLRHLNQEFRRHLNVQAEELETRMRNAEGRREWCSSTSVERREMSSASLLVLPSSPQQCSLRKRPASAPRPTSATSDPRIVSARMVRDAIERNLTASRVRHVAQSDAAVRAAASRASARIKARSTRVRITWTRRRVAHLASAARLRAKRGAAVARLRSRIRAEERKIAALLAAKERSVASSRAQAAVAAQLRENLRGTLSPTTFDRMASDVQNILRIPSSSRSWTAEHHSVTHIKLG